ncbi:MAG: hypothetical protein IMX05_06310 [Hydrogenibacillus schlegelii]|nr:hypothetical protein [Hydrogenibacillus schlegelii]
MARVKNVALALSVALSFWLSVALWLPPAPTASVGEAPYAAPIRFDREAAPDMLLMPTLSGVAGADGSFLLPPEAPAVAAALDALRHLPAERTAPPADLPPGRPGGWVPPPAPPTPAAKRPEGGAPGGGTAPGRPPGESAAGEGGRRPEGPGAAGGSQPRPGLYFAWSAGLSPAFFSRLFPDWPPPTLPEVDALWVAFEAAGAVATAIDGTTGRAEAWRLQAEEDLVQTALAAGERIPLVPWAPPPAVFAPAIPAAGAELSAAVVRAVGLPPEAAAEALLGDLGALREARERDGTWLLSDGARSLRLDPRQGTLDYFAPAAGRPRPAREAFEAAVAFVNRHAGWGDGDRLLGIAATADGTAFHFGGTASGFPITGAARAVRDLVVVVDGGEVVRYRRGLFRWLPPDGDGRARLPGVQEILTALEAAGRRPEAVRRSQLVFVGEKTASPGAYRLVPALLLWADGDVLVLPPDEAEGRPPG